MQNLDEQSCVAVTPLAVVRYDIAALISRFDKREDGETGLTGKVSSLLGEPLLLSALLHYLRTNREHAVEILDDRPHRDDAEFVISNEEVPAFRDLDAWLLLNRKQVVAVECKHRTSSSMNVRSVPDNSRSLSAYARIAWDRLVSEHFAPWVWTEVNKIALPLKPPWSMPSVRTATAGRILAIWTPVSQHGSCTSSLVTKTLCDGQWVYIDVEVFSASLYLRSLLDAGVKYLESEAEEVKRLLAAINAVVQLINPAA